MEELTLAVGDIIVGMDIGTSKISLVIGEVTILVRLKQFVVPAICAMELKKEK